MTKSLKKRKVTKIRVSKNQQKMLDEKYIGPEPNTLNFVSITNALNWYNYMLSAKEAKQFLIDYLKLSNRKEEIKKLRAVPDQWIPSTAAWLARMSLNGIDIEDKYYEFIENKLNFALTKSVVEKPKEETKQVVSIQERMRERLSEIIGEIECIVDDRANQVGFSLFEWLKEKEIPATYASSIANYYRPLLEELLDAYQGLDKEIKEGYSRMDKEELEYAVVFIDSIIQDAESYGSVVKKTRKARKPKPISVEKKLKTFKYMKESDEYKIASVSPDKIIGAQELWTFNTKSKMITVYKALDRGGLDVKGTTIINYDESNSETRRTGRKTEEFVQKILKSGKIVLKKIMEEMGSQGNLAGRINEATILLRVM